MEGIVLNIQRYVLHDGPGIRTSVFLKGCPLTCKWCHNPESISPSIETAYRKDVCIECLSCHSQEHPEVCPTNALKYVGEKYTADRLMKEIEKDIIFFNQSGGGVTFSGGEPLMQSTFLLEILILCKKSNLHVTIDTSGYSKWENIEPLLPYVDLFLYDLKSMNDDIHKQYTGVSNEIIIENLKKISRRNEVLLRIPIIKDVNDDIQNITASILLAKTCHIKKIHFLPFHGFGENKYLNLQSKLNFQTFESPSKESLESYILLCLEHGIEGVIGG